MLIATRPSLVSTPTEHLSQHLAFFGINACTRAAEVAYTEATFEKLLQEIFSSFKTKPNCRPQSQISPFLCTHYVSNAWGRCSRSNCILATKGTINLLLPTANKSAVNCSELTNCICIFMLYPLPLSFHSSLHPSHSSNTIL